MDRAWEVSVFQPSQTKSIYFRNGISSAGHLRSLPSDKCGNREAKLRRSSWRFACLAPISALLLALTLPSLPALGENLWHDAQLGMSPAQISTLFPAARVGSHRRLNSGASNELSLSDYAIGDDSFSIDFFFLGGRLDEVIVRLDKVESQASQANQAAFEHLVAATTREHGRPSGCQTTRNITLFRGCEWQTKEIRVDVIFVEVGGQGVVLNAYYRPRVTKT